MKTLLVFLNIGLSLFIGYNLVAQVFKPGFIFYFCLFFVACFIYVLFEFILEMFE